MCIYILVGLFLYMMSAPVHGYLGAYFGMQGRSVQGWHCNPSNTCGMLFLVWNVFCMYNAVGCTQSQSAWWLVRSVVPTLVDVMSKKVACLHQGCCANLIQYIKSRVWYQEYTTVYSTSVGCLLCSSWLIASMFRRDPFAACMALVKQQFHSHHQEIRETYLFATNYTHPIIDMQRILQRSM